MKGLKMNPIFCISIIFSFAFGILTVVFFLLDYKETHKYGVEISSETKGLGSVLGVSLFLTGLTVLFEPEAPRHPVQIIELQNVKYFSCESPMLLVVHTDQERIPLYSNRSQELFNRLPPSIKHYDPPRTFIATMRNGALLSIYPKE
jgi:hypothetical protein